MIVDGYLIGRNVDGGWIATTPDESITADTYAELLIKIDQRIHPERCSE